MQTRRLLAATSAIAVLGLAACSGESGSDSSRPDAAQVADTLSADEGFEELGITDDQLMCVSQAYVDSDLSDEALQALIGGDEEYVRARRTRRSSPT